MSDEAVEGVHIEFLVEPFVAGSPGPHVGAAVDAVEADGIVVDVGPFANSASGSIDEVVAAVADMLRAAFVNGATRVSLTADLADAAPRHSDLPAAGAAPAPSDAKEFLAAVRPVVAALGASVVRTARSGDVPVRWRGEVVAAVRPSPLTGALDHLIGKVEQELGGSLASLDRSAKQRAVGLLHEQGAFAMRRSVESVATAMGCSRITIYNYLNALEAG